MKNLDFAFLAVVFLVARAQNGHGSENSCYTKDVEIYGSCYQFNNELLNFQDALNFCARQGYTLTRIQDRPTGHFIASHAASVFSQLYGNFWIGLLHRNSFYQWVDGQPVSFTNWGRGYPFGNLNYTGARISDATWVSLQSEQLLPFVCHYEKGQWIQTTAGNIDTVSTEAPNSCAVDDIYLGQRCYSFNKNHLSRSQAEAACHDQKKTLAIFDDLSQLRFIASTAGHKLGMTYGAYWIGLSQPQPKSVQVSQFYWDNHVVDHINYWSNGYPYESQTVALQQVSNGKWITANQDQTWPSVCSGTYN